MHRSVLEDPEFVTWANENVIVLVGHPKGSHQSVDVAKPAKGEPKSQCSLYPGITCADHEKIYADATPAKEEKKDEKAKPAPKAKSKKDEGPALPKLEVTGFPASYVVEPDGTIEKHGADRQPGSCKDRLLEVQRKFDENPVPLSKWEAYKAAFAEGEKAWKDGKTKAALTAYAKVDADSGKLSKGTAEKLKARLEPINAKIAEKFAAAQKLSGDVAAKVKAVKALRAELDVTLATPLAVTADLDAWLKDNDAAAPAAPAPPAPK